LRDDALSIVAELSRSYQKKIKLLRALLLSETDKLYYEKSGNIEKVFEIIRNDASVIVEADLVGYAIAKSEDELSALIGVKPGALYGILEGTVDAGELLSLRTEARDAVKRLMREHAELTARLEAGSLTLAGSIDELSSICRLKQDEDGEQQKGS
jgi:hypothetical protein